MQRERVSSAYTRGASIRPFVADQLLALSVVNLQCMFSDLADEVGFVDWADSGVVFNGLPE